MARLLQFVSGTPLIILPHPATRPKYGRVFFSGTTSQSQRQDLDRHHDASTNSLFSVLFLLTQLRAEPEGFPLPPNTFRFQRQRFPADCQHIEAKHKSNYGHHPCPCAVCTCVSVLRAGQFLFQSGSTFASSLATLVSLEFLRTKPRADV